MSKLTPWFPGTVKPARPGVYQRNAGDGGWMWARWTGMKWCYRHESHELAAVETAISADQDQSEWRGLIEEPKS